MGRRSRIGCGAQPVPGPTLDRRNKRPFPTALPESPSRRAMRTCTGAAARRIEREQSRPLARNGSGGLRRGSERPQFLRQVPRIVVGVQNDIAFRGDSDHGDAAVGRAEAPPTTPAHREYAADEVSDQVSVAHEHLTGVSSRRAPQVPAVCAIGLVLPALDDLSRRSRRVVPLPGRQTGNALAQQTRSEQRSALESLRDDLRGLHGSFHRAAMNRCDRETA